MEKEMVSINTVKEILIRQNWMPRWVDEVVAELTGRDKPKTEREQTIHKIWNKQVSNTPYSCKEISKILEGVAFVPEIATDKHEEVFCRKRGFLLNKSGIQGLFDYLREAK